MSTLPLSFIRLDGGTQQRAEINEAAVEEYALAYAEGVNLPPVVVIFDGADNWLADGFHRFHAAARAGRDEIQVDVRSGTRRDAVWHSICANREHGLRRTNADKRKAVQALLADPEWAQWSDREIARRVGVTHPFVAALRPAKVVTVTTLGAGEAPPAPAKADVQPTVATPIPAPAPAPVVTVTTSAPSEAPPPASGGLAPLTPKPGLEPSPSAISEGEQDLTAQLAADLERALKDNALMGEIFDADDRLKAATEKVKQLQGEVENLRQRVGGLMAEKNVAIQKVTSLQRQVKALEAQLKEAAV